MYNQEEREQEVDGVRDDDHDYHNNEDMTINTLLSILIASRKISLILTITMISMVIIATVLIQELQQAYLCTEERDGGEE